MSTQKSNVTCIDQYKALLLLYASHVDLDYSPDEREFIIKQVGLDITVSSEAQFDSMSDYEVLAYLVKHRSEFMPGEKGRQEAMELLQALFNIDGDFSRLEYSSLQFLDKMFFTTSDLDSAE